MSEGEGSDLEHNQEAVLGRRGTGAQRPPSGWRSKEQG